MEFIQELILELNSNTAYSTIGAKQGDNNSRVVKIFITKNGAAYNLNENNVSSAYFRLRKPDGKAIINTATISSDGTYLSIVFTSQALAVAGRGYADITLMSGAQILSTVSFVLLIMASPQIAEQVTSSNEFGYLNAVVEDATHTIYEAEAWAAGTRGGIPVYGETDFTYSYVSSVINYLDVDEVIFLQKVASTPGLKRTFTFTYTEDNNWNLVLTTQEGNTTSISNPEIIGSINDYGITIGLLGGTDSPNAGDTITVIIEEADKTFENNAKYYAEIAEQSKEAIENLSATAEKVKADDFTTSLAYAVGDYVWYQGELYEFIAPHTPGAWNSSQVEQQILIEKTVIDNTAHLHFKLPQGPTGDVNIMTFEINAEDGQLYMYKPASIEQIDFRIPQSGEENAGCLVVMINMGGNT